MIRPTSAPYHVRQLDTLTLYKTSLRWVSRQQHQVLLPLPVHQPEQRQITPACMHHEVQGPKPSECIFPIVRFAGEGFCSWPELWLQHLLWDTPGRLETCLRKPATGSSNQQEHEHETCNSFMLPAHT